MPMADADCRRRRRRYRKGEGHLAPRHSAHAVVAQPSSPDSAFAPSSGQPQPRTRSVRLDDGDDISPAPDPGSIIVVESPALTAAHEVRRIFGLPSSLSQARLQPTQKDVHHTLVAYLWDYHPTLDDKSMNFVKDYDANIPAPSDLETSWSARQLAPFLREVHGPEVPGDGLPDGATWEGKRWAAARAEVEGLDYDEEKGDAAPPTPAPPPGGTPAGTRRPSLACKLVNSSDPAAASGSNRALPQTASSRPPLANPREWGSKRVFDDLVDPIGRGPMCEERLGNVELDKFAEAPSAKISRLQRTLGGVFSSIWHAYTRLHPAANGPKSDPALNPEGTCRAFLDAWKRCGYDAYVMDGNGRERDKWSGHQGTSTPQHEGYATSSRQPWVWDSWSRSQAWNGDGWQAAGKETLLARLNQLAEKGEVAAAERVFRDLLPGSRMVWNTMIKACSNAGDLPRAEGLVREMRAGAVQENVQTFGKLIEAAAKSGDDESAERWMAELQRRGFQLNRVVLSAVVIRLVR
ncbi:unnamed protein product [Prorocentrum cordatum]|uniref:Uncharacterized protein n=1 Tax=Prorocentrum cordatum TaxID=2364126 RepID=A0ABN9TV94_9DINO|nr:unnamed protein product [Polarella glacialis]